MLHATWPGDEIEVAFVEVTGVGSFISVQVALNPPDPTALSAVMKDNRSISVDEINCRVSLLNPSPHNSIGGAARFFQIRTTAPGHPRDAGSPSMRKNSKNNKIRWFGLTFMYQLQICRKGGYGAG